MSQRAASLNLEWSWIQNGFWYADLPTIPGYTYQTDPPCARVLPVYTATGKRKDEWKLEMGFNTIVDGNAKLTNNSFGIPNTETAEEMMQAVDNLSVEEISQTLADHDYYAYFPDEPEYQHNGYWDTLSGEWIEARKDARAKHATRRKADLGLQWYDETDDYDHLFYYADLPEIPGYTDVNENESYAQVYAMEDYSDIPETPGYEKGKWGFRLLIDDIQGAVNLYATDFDLPPAGSADEAMSMVDSLTIQDIQDAMGAGEPVTAHRTASMDLTWVKNDGDPVLYEALLPTIPGYPGVDSVDVWKDDEEPGDRWCFALCQNGYPLSIRTNDEFGIPSADTAEEMMTAIENLDPQEIADVLAANGYMPDED